MPENVSQLPRRREAFARHVAAGRSLAEAARLSGYAHDSARQTGSRLMKEGEVAARVAQLAAEEDRRQREETDELVGILKRVMLDAVERHRHSAALRAVDQIARFRGLAVAKPAARGSAARAGDGDGHAPAPTNTEESDGPPGDVDNFSNILFDPPMPPESIPPVEAAPVPPDPKKEESKAREAKAERRSLCRDLIVRHHPQLIPRIRDGEEPEAFFDADYRLLPADRWPEDRLRLREPAPASAVSAPAPAQAPASRAPTSPVRGR
ncbi:hypothetical protein JL101_000065 [Skermanella rosea]|uniref:hypothetical protein n=1 Tax=Skermanella rosea TaxID=1817965 RepID=UPI001933FBBE|nr:hypothetical protein [Skermanella rosea]UEM03879.1 hypothetical protein JL101_000065 [Skermanella rosea]